MTRRQTSRSIARGAVIACVLTLLLGSSPVSAGRQDRKRPTTPQNLRVTAVTPFGVSLAWDPSTDDSGSFSYRVHQSWGYDATVPQTQTSFTWTYGVYSGYTYSFYVFAVDAAGNRSQNSNTVTATIPPDTTAPTTPAVSVTDVGPNYVSLAWSSTDEGPEVRYWVYKDGAPVISGTTARSGNVFPLESDTTYGFTVQARDAAGNLSPLSEHLAVTTEPAVNDTSPPAAPTNVVAEPFADTEFHIYWTQSTDDYDPQWLIHYETYVNGELADVAVGAGRTSSIVYLEFGRTNTISVIAIDSSGNRSGPTTITYDFFNF
jgi:hypothetical protein